MLERNSKRIFVFLFFLMILIPVFTINFKETVSKAENRKLAGFPGIYRDDGGINTDIIEDFEAWFNDNIGLRSNFVMLNAKIQYYVFGVLPSSCDTILGPEGEFDYATENIIRSYQHLDMINEKELGDYVKSIQYVNDYLETKGIQFYYMQCWDKQSVYPEHFPNTIIQHGDISRTELITSVVEQGTNVCVINPKQALIDGKKEYDTYSRWGDATHWTQRGAYIGYRLLMDAINERNDGRYKVLSSEDYDIKITDQGDTLLGCIHKEEMLENFKIDSPHAYLSDEEPAWLSQWANRSRRVYYNDDVDNDDTLLIIGDSYLDNYLYDDLAESFHKVVLVWGDYVVELPQIIDYYNPDIVLMENAERSERTGLVTMAVDIMNEQ